jgi:hypothetical protein
MGTLFLATPLLHAAIPPAESLLPSDTLAFFAMPDCAAARVAAKSSPPWMFWNDAAMKPFRDKLVGKWNEQFIAPLERDLGIKVADFMDLPQGQLTVALTVNGSSGHDDVPPGLLMLLDAQGKSPSLKTNLAMLTKKWADAGRALRTETFHGLAFTVVPLSSNDFASLFPKKAPVSELGKEPAKPEKPGELYIAQFETLLIAGNSPKVVEPVAAHLTGGSAPAIADNALFAADKMSQFHDKPEYYAWFNSKGFFDLVSQAPANTSDEDSPSPLGNLSAMKAINGLGLTSLKSASVALHDTREGSTMTIHLTAPEADRAGLLKILALPPKDASVPPFVPADAVKFSRYRIDGKQAWAEIQKMVASFSPSGMAGLNAAISMANSLGQQKNPGFDIRNDLFGNLNDDIISYQKPASGASLADLANQPTLYLIAVANPDAMINVIKTINSMSNPQDNSATPREFLGRKIYSIGLRAARNADGTQEKRSLYASSSGGYMALSMDSAILEEFLRSAEGQNKPLRENTALQNAMQQLGGAGGGMFGYENQRETMRVTFKALQDTTTADNALKMFPPSVRDWLDFSLLPSYDAVSKYFFISTFAGNANSSGITFKVFQPRPPTLN